MSKRGFSKRLIAADILGFAIVILWLWMDEVADVPHYLFGAPRTPVNLTECLYETVLVGGLGVFLIARTIRLLSRLKYLEGFLPVCAFCKRIRVGEEWIPIESYISSNSAARFSHGFCPDCVRKHYSEFLGEPEGQRTEQGKPEGPVQKVGRRQGRQETNHSDRHTSTRPEEPR
jgi:hypothetical protein